MMPIPRSDLMSHMHAEALRRHAQAFPVVTSLLRPSAPRDSIALDLPWGQQRNFLVPAADPRNPKFQIFPRRKAVEPEEITLDKIHYTTEWR